ncbi:hypothetical protein PROFUN_12255 [Planoprotostelium fungivorum]|uniref:Uncharacterized protein n=1 Tax=Planoprotostelium fungivorum TaxID=1890364 RepID=A0A2P6N835_9EUKA|nr:hypothetical protein PROFUN_12255 [Planoprotostelium fungivorum]
MVKGEKVTKTTQKKLNAPTKSFGSKLAGAFRLITNTTKDSFLNGVWLAQTLIVPVTVLFVMIVVPLNRAIAMDEFLIESTELNAGAILQDYENTVEAIKKNQAMNGDQPTSSTL